MVIDLDELFAEADAILEAAEPVTVPVVLGKRTLGVRFLPMSGADWQYLTAQHPPRPNVPREMRLGYNVDAVVAAYPDVALIDGDVVDPLLRTDEDGNQVSKWPEVWARLTSTGRKDVSTEMWAVHELIPDRLVDDAGKASTGSPRKKRS